MAKGWITENSKPEGRRGFADPVEQTGLGDHTHNTVPMGQIVRGPTSDYLSHEGRAHRAALGSRPRATPDNPTVHSKATRRYGRNPFGGQSLNVATDLVHGGTGSQPAEFERGPVPPLGNLRELMQRGKR